MKSEELSASTHYLGKICIYRIPIHHSCLRKRKESSLRHQSLACWMCSCWSLAFATCRGISPLVGLLVQGQIACSGIGLDYIVGLPYLSYEQKERVFSFIRSSHTCIRDVMSVVHQFLSLVYSSLSYLSVLMWQVSWRSSREIIGSMFHPKEANKLGFVINPRGIKKALYLVSLERRRLGFWKPQCYLLCLLRRKGNVLYEPRWTV